MPEIQQQEVGLALGAGGARGWAHIGVINAVREAGIDVRYVSGTSMGALVGAAFCSERLPGLQDVALTLDWKRVIYHFLELSLPRMGLIDGNRIVAFVEEHVDPIEIGQLALPFAAVAVDVLTGDEIVLKEGPVSDAVRASIAIPGMFTPLVMGDRVLVDGGLVNPLPINVARELGASFVIAVDITRSPLPAKHDVSKAPEDPDAIQTDAVEPSGDGHGGLRERLEHLLRRADVELSSLPAMKRWFARDPLPNIFDIYGNSMRIIQRQITATRLKLEPPDLLIQPDVQDISTMDFHRAGDAIQAGYDAAREALRRIMPS